MEFLTSITSDSSFWIFASVLLAVLIGAWRIISFSKQLPLEPVESVLEDAKKFADNKIIEIEKEREEFTHAIRSNQPLAAVEVADVKASIEVVEVPETAPEEIKKKGGRPKKIIVPFILLTLLASCVPGLWTKENVGEGIELIKYFTTNKDSAKVKTPTDSIVIKFNPVYYRVKPYDGIGEFETDQQMAGYRIWELQTPAMRRTEIQKLDSVIYIYKK